MLVLSTISNEINDKFDVYLIIVVILYPDDIILLTVLSLLLDIFLLELCIVINGLIDYSLTFSQRYFTMVHDRDLETR
jgi:hypothetical protein